MAKMQDIGALVDTGTVANIVNGLSSKLSELNGKISMIEEFCTASNDRLDTFEKETKERLSLLESLVEAYALLEKNNLWLTHKFYNIIAPVSILRSYSFELEKAPWYKKLFAFQRKKIYKKIEQQLTAYWSPQEENAYKDYRNFDKREYFFALGYTKEQVDKYLVGKKAGKNSNNNAIN